MLLCLRNHEVSMSRRCLLVLGDGVNASSSTLFTALKAAGLLAEAQARRTQAEVLALILS